MTSFNLIENRVKSIKTITILFLILGLLLSSNLWIGKRQFPMIPCANSFENIPYSLNYLLFPLLLLLLLYDIFKENKWSLITSLIILFFFLLQDQNRLQPWVYIYILILIPYCISNHFKNLEIDLLIPIKIILIATYFWSGIQKANVNFIEGVFVHILMDLFKIQSIETIRSVLPLGYIISFTEIFIAFSLMFKKLRNIGIALAICTHTFILLYTSPLGLNNNYIIYPWNVAMILLVITLFVTA